MKLLVFVPDDPALKQALEGALARFPNVKRVEAADPDPKAQWVWINPPRNLDELKKIDATCAKALPRALFVIPKEQEPFRNEVKPIHGHYHAARRSRDVLRAKDLAGAVRLESKSSSIIRWGALGPVSAIALALFVIVFFYRDAIAKAAVQKGLQAAFGAKAEVGGVGALGVKMNAIAVANAGKPMANLYEFDKAAFAVDWTQLMSGRVHVDEMTLEGLKFGTARSESGALPGVEPPAEPEVPPAGGQTLEQSLQELLKKLEPPVLEDLETVKVARRIEKESRERMARVEQVVKDATGRIDATRRTVEELSKIEPPASVTSVQAALSGAGSLRPPSLDAAKKELAAANLVTFDDEKKAMEQAKKDVEGTKEAVGKATAAIEKAKKIEKVSITDIPKIKKLIDEMKDAKKAVDEAVKKVDAATKSVAAAKDAVAKKQKESEERLKGAGANMDAARKALDQGGDLGKKIAELGDQVGKAKADLEAQQKELMPKLAAVQGEIKGAREFAETVKKQVEEDVAFVKAQPDELKKALLRDRDELAKRYNLEQFNADDLLKSLLGERVAGWLRWSLKTYRTVRPWLSRAKKERAKPAKGPDGTTYAFPIEEPKQPGFWLKKASFSGDLGDGFRLTGKAQDVSSDPAAVGRAGSLSFTAEAGARRLAASLAISTGGGVSVDLEATGFPVTGGRIENRIAPAVIGDGVLTVKANAAFEGESIRAGAHVAIEGMKITPVAGGDARLAFLGDVYKSLSGVSADLELRWTDGKVSEFRCRSDKGKEITESLRRALTGQVEEAKRIAFGKIDEQVAGPRRAAESAIGEFLGKAAAGAVPGVGELESKTGAIAGRNEELSKLLTAGSDPKAAIDGMRKELDAMTTQSGDLGKRNASGAAESSKSIEEAGGAVGESTKSLGGVQGEIQAQIERITKLMKP